MRGDTCPEPAKPTRWFENSKSGASMVFLSFYFRGLGFVKISGLRLLIRDLTSGARLILSGSGLWDSSPVGAKIGCPNPPGLDVETPLWKQDPESQTHDDPNVGA